LPEGFDLGGQVVFQLGELPDHFRFQFVDGGDHAAIAGRARHRGYHQPHPGHQQDKASLNAIAP
jgi:hypothetical protein